MFFYIDSFEQECMLLVEIYGGAKFRIGMVLEPSGSIWGLWGCLGTVPGPAGTVSARLVLLHQGSAWVGLARPGLAQFTLAQIGSAPFLSWRRAIF